MPEAASKPTPSGKPMNQRLVTGLIFASIVIAFALAGGWIWGCAVFGACYLAYLELVGIMKAKGVNPSRITVGLVGVAMFIAASLHKSTWFQPIITAGIILSFFRLLFRQPRSTINDIGATILAIFYVGFFPMYYIMLRNLGSGTQSNPLLQGGMGYLFLIMIILSASDIGAYYAGRAFGKHPLYPEISPKKTREGALLGTLAGVVCGGIFSWCIGFPLDHGVILSFLISIVGQLGDLSESLLKRDAGIKDSGSLLKGHGGILDRIDSYIFSGAVAYYYIYWIILKQGLAQELLEWLAHIHSPVLG